MSSMIEYAFEELSSDQLRSEKIKQLYSYWKQLRGDRLYPSLSDIQLSQIPELSPYIALNELHYAPLKIWCCYAGEQMTHYYQRDFNNCWLHDMLEADERRHFEVVHRMAITRLEPLFCQEYWSSEHQLHQYQWGIFPLADNGSTVNANMVIEDFSDLDKDIIFLQT